MATEAWKNKPWKLDLIGDFRLSDPEGRPVRLPTGKVEGLLAVLVVHRTFGIERDAAAEILWPGGTLDKQRANFRQALSHLRRILGEGAIISSRSKCSLSSDFEIDCDFDGADLSEPCHEFMPTHSGEWFDHIRNGDEGEEAPVSDHFLRTLEWYAENDPGTMFSILRASQAMAKGMVCRDLLMLLDVAGSIARWAGWEAYWRGASEEDLPTCALSLQKAIRFAKVDEDWELASVACFELGKVYSRTGEYAKALKICGIAQSVAERARTRSSQANVFRLKGAIQLHWGDPTIGLDALVRCEDLIEDRVEHAMAVSSRAYYEASLGRFDQAARTLDIPIKVGREVGHFGIDVVGGYTRGLLAVAEGARFQAIKELERVADRCYKAQLTQFGVYSDELLAKLFYLEGDRRLSRSRIQAACEGRKASQMVLTPLEARRVATVR